MQAGPDRQHEPAAPWPGAVAANGRQRHPQQDDGHGQQAESKQGVRCNCHARNYIRGSDRKAAATE